MQDNVIIECRANRNNYYRVTLNSNREAVRVESRANGAYRKLWADADGRDMSLKVACAIRAALRTLE